MHPSRPSLPDQVLSVSTLGCVEQMLQSTISVYPALTEGILLSPVLCGNTEVDGKCY